MSEAWTPRPPCPSCGKPRSLCMTCGGLARIVDGEAVHVNESGDPITPLSHEAFIHGGCFGKAPA